MYTGRLVFAMLLRETVRSISMPSVLTWRLDRFSFYGISSEPGPRIDQYRSHSVFRESEVDWRITSSLPSLLQHVVASPANDAVQIEFEPMKLPPTTGRATNVARVTFYREWAGRRREERGTSVGGREDCPQRIGKMGGDRERRRGD